MCFPEGALTRARSIAPRPARDRRISFPASGGWLHGVERAPGFCRRDPSVGAPASRPGTVRSGAFLRKTPVLLPDPVLRPGRGGRGEKVLRALRVPVPKPARRAPRRPRRRCLSPLSRFHGEQPSFPRDARRGGTLSGGAHSLPRTLPDSGDAFAPQAASVPPRILRMTAPAPFAPPAPPTLLAFCGWKR